MKIRGLFNYNMSISGAVRSYRMFIGVNSSDLEFIAVPPFGGEPSNPDMMQRLAEYACRINYLRRMGTWSMDYTDGEIRLRYNLLCVEITPPKQQITLELLLVNKEIKIWSPGFLSIILSGESAKNAFLKCQEAQKK